MREARGFSKTGILGETRPFSAFVFRGGKPAGSNNHAIL